MSANFDRACVFDPAEITTTSTIVLFSLALLNFSIHLVGIGRYGFFRDELYYLACGQHLAWGYVDQPPLIAVAAWVSQHAFGTSLAATRLLPAAAGALLVLLTGLLTRELGGSLRAQVLASVTILFAPAVLAMNSFLSMNAFEPVFWALGAILIARILNGGSARLWLWFGLVTGVAFLNKHTILVFGFATVVGMLASGLPREFTRRSIWLGGAIALAIFLPNLIWEARNHWPQIEAVRNDRAVKTLALSPLQYLWEQVLFMSPVSLPVALSGLAWYFSSTRGKQFRPLGYIVLCSAVIFIFFKGKAYYLLPAYPILFAAGGVALEPFLFAPNHWWRGRLYLGVLILAGLVTLPFGVPVLPLDLFLRYQRVFPLTHEVKSERDSTSELPQLYADEFGWPEMTATIYRLLMQRALRVLSQGHSVVVDAVFAREDERAAIHGIARKLNIRFVGLFLQTDLATRVSRVGRRQRDASDATPEIAGQQEQYDIGAIDWDIIDACGTPEQTQERCQARIAREVV